MFDSTGYIGYRVYLHHRVMMISQGERVILQERCEKGLYRLEENYSPSWSSGFPCVKNVGSLHHGEVSGRSFVESSF